MKSIFNDFDLDSTSEMVSGFRLAFQISHQDERPWLLQLSWTAYKTA